MDSGREKPCFLVEPSAGRGRAIGDGAYRSVPPTDITAAGRGDRRRRDGEFHGGPPSCRPCFLPEAQAVSWCCRAGSRQPLTDHWPWPARQRRIFTPPSGACSRVFRGTGPGADLPEVRPCPASGWRHSVPGRPGRERAAGPAVTCARAGQPGSGRCEDRGELGHRRCRRSVPLQGRGHPPLAGAAVACGSVVAPLRFPPRRSR